MDLLGDDHRVPTEKSDTRRFLLQWIHLGMYGHVHKDMPAVISELVKEPPFFPTSSGLGYILLELFRYGSSA